METVAKEPEARGDHTGSPRLRDLYATITQLVLDRLAQGVVPWHKPWRGGDASPANLLSKKPYRGINAVTLSLAERPSRWWVTELQAEKLGGKLRSGERPMPIVYWGWRTKSLPGVSRRDARQLGLFDVWVPYLRSSNVYNVDQIEGRLRRLPKEAPAPPPFRPIEAARGIADLYLSKAGAPTLLEKGFHAYYRPSADLICVPPPGQFESAEAYYSTLFHEMGHASGHPSRLRRKGITDRVMFGDHDYSYEELVAEFTACFLCAEAAIERITLDNSAAYIAEWRSRLQGDLTLVFRAAAMAQRASDLVLGRSPKRVRRTNEIAIQPGPTIPERAVERSLRVGAG